MKYTTLTPKKHDESDYTAAEIAVGIVRTRTCDLALFCHQRKARVFVASKQRASAIPDSTRPDARHKFLPLCNKEGMNAVTWHFDERKRAESERRL
jgi:hypothetical protein